MRKPCRTVSLLRSCRPCCCCTRIVCRLCSRDWRLHSSSLEVWEGCYRCIAWEIREQMEDLTLRFRGSLGSTKAVNERGYTDVDIGESGQSLCRTRRGQD